MQGIHLVKIAVREQIKLGNWGHYEKYGNYCIRYTEPIKFVLEIKPLD